MMTLPGALYSLILAVGAWAIGYFSTGGAGGATLYAPIALAVIPIILKLFTVQTPPGTSAAPRAMGNTPRHIDGSPVEPSKTRRFLLG